MRAVAIVVALAAASGCTTIPAVGSTVTLDPNTASQCRAHCQTLGMDLGAVVIIRNSTGCVCQPAGKPVAEAGASAVSGGAAIQAMDEEQTARQHHGNGS